MRRLRDQWDRVRVQIRGQRRTLMLGLISLLGVGLLLAFASTVWAKGVDGLWTALSAVGTVAAAASATYFGTLDSRQRARATRARMAVFKMHVKGDLHALHGVLFGHRKALMNLCLSDEAYKPSPLQSRLLGMRQRLGENQLTARLADLDSIDHEDKVRYHAIDYERGRLKDAIGHFAAAITNDLDNGQVGAYLCLIRMYALGKLLEQVLGLDTGRYSFSADIPDEWMQKFLGKDQITVADI